MRPYWGDHRDSVHVSRLYQLSCVAMDWNSGMRCLNAFASGGSLIADPDDLAAFQGAPDCARYSAPNNRSRSRQT